MNDKQYTEILRGVCYLFKEYSPAYALAKKSQAEYYLRNKEKYIKRQKERYHENPDEKEKIKARASKWNKLIKS
jgi:hypothetical protein